MTISIKEDNLTVAIELEENDFDKSVSCEDAMIAAFDVLKNRSARRVRKVLVVGDHKWSSKGAMFPGGRNQSE